MLGVEPAVLCCAAEFSLAVTVETVAVEPEAVREAEGDVTVAAEE